MAGGACMAGGMHGGGMHGREHAWPWGVWQGRGTCVAERHAWQRGMCAGGNTCQERRPLQWTLRILLERFLVFILLTSSY